MLKNQLKSEKLKLLEGELTLNEFEYKTKRASKKNNRNFRKIEMNIESIIDMLVISETFNEKRLSKEQWLKSRKYPVCLIRQVAIFILCKTSNRSGNYIAKCFGKNHATILYTNKKVSDMLDVKYEDVCRYYLLLKHFFEWINF